MNVPQDTPTFWSAAYSDWPIFSIYGLCNELARTQGAELLVLTTDSAGPRLEQRIPVDAFLAPFVFLLDALFSRKRHVSAGSTQGRSQ